MPKTRPLLAALAAITLSALLTGPARALATAGPVPGRPAVVSVLVEDAASPWSDHNGIGLANDLVRAAFEAAGAPASLSVVPYARCKALVISGAAPSCFSMSAAPEFDGTVRFADKPLFSVTAEFYAASARARPPRALGDIAGGTRVGIVNGYEYPPAILALARRGVIFQPARSEVVNLRKLAGGRVDLVIVMTDPLRSRALVERQAHVANVSHVFTGPSMGSFIGFSTHHPEGERQRQLFNSGFRAIAENGRRAALESKWKSTCSQFCPE